MSMMTAIAKLFGQAGAAMAAEHYIMKAIPAGGIMAAVQLSVPKIYGALLLTNVFIPSFTLMYIAFGIVSPARKKYNVPLPTMYAVSQKEGDDAYKFNCCQRAHQNALETFPIFLAASLAGGLKHPILVGLSGLLWSYARVQWAHGYATGVPGNRYSHSVFGRHVWTALLIPLLCTASVGIQMMM